MTQFFRLNLDAECCADWAAHDPQTLRYVDKICEDLSLSGRWLVTLAAPDGSIVDIIRVPQAIIPGGPQ